jgi:hypothetical protein
MLRRRSSYIVINEWFPCHQYPVYSDSVNLHSCLNWEVVNFGRLHSGEGSRLEGWECIDLERHGVSWQDYEQDHWKCKSISTEEQVYVALDFIWNVLAKFPAIGSCYLHAVCESVNSLLITFEYRNKCQLNLTVYGGAPGKTVANVLCHKPRGSGFETRWGKRIVSIYLILLSAIGPGVYSASNTSE